MKKKSLLPLDRKGRRAQWLKARVAERSYRSRLLAVARQVGEIVKAMAPKKGPQQVPALVSALNKYAEVIDPWAKAVATAMVADVARRDRQMWKAVGEELGKGIRREIEYAPTGAIMAQLQDEQVKLIKSLPLEAAQRVHEMTTAAVSSGRRAADIVDDILATGDVTATRARLIARTEVARASANLMQGRAEYAGSEGYVWRTSEDDDVRPSHKRMEGRYVRWTEPPTLDGLTGHAGTLPNCRCFSEPIFPDD